MARKFIFQFLNIFLISITLLAFNNCSDPFQSLDLRELDSRPIDQSPPDNTSPGAQVPEGDYDDFIANAIAHILPDNQSPTRTIYVAPVDGATVGSGTKVDPYRDLLTVLANAQAGDRIYLRPGVYYMSEVRDRFGHNHSAITINNSGAPGNPIIFSTDPEEYDPANNQIAVLDFQYDNLRPGIRASNFYMDEDYWIIENLEMRNIESRGMMLSGFNNIIRNTHMHHLNTPGTNNEGFVVITASGRPTNNFLIRNHFHHIGVIDRDTNTLTSLGGVNVACVYTETRQVYDSTFRSLNTVSTVEELKQGILPPDSHVYLYNNRIHHCAKGLATKTVGEGPYFFLANIIYDVDTGIKTAYSNSVNRDNIIYSTGNPGGTGIQIGQPAGGDDYLDAATNGVNIEIANNTIVNFNLGMNFYGGWSSRAHHNLIVGESNGWSVHRNQYFWFQAGVWPGLRGEYLLGDLDNSHPYRNTHFASMPSVLYQFGFRRLVVENNAYSRTPLMRTTDAANNADLNGRNFDADHVELTPGEISQLFRDPANHDYRRNLTIYPEYGSRLQ